VDVISETDIVVSMHPATICLTKLGVNSGLTPTVRVECSPEGGVSPQKREEIKSALRELGLNGDVH
jgi:hypothetical protein